MDVISYKRHTAVTPNIGQRPATELSHPVERLPHAYSTPATVNQMHISTVLTKDLHVSFPSLSNVAGYHAKTTIIILPYSSVLLHHDQVKPTDLKGKTSFAYVRQENVYSSCLHISGIGKPGHIIRHSSLVSAMCVAMICMRGEIHAEHSWSIPANYPVSSITTQEAVLLDSIINSMNVYVSQVFIYAGHGSRPV